MEIFVKTSLVLLTIGAAFGTCFGILDTTDLHAGFDILIGSVTGMAAVGIIAAIIDF